jgi:hypothetical protein
VEPQSGAPGEGDGPPSSRLRGSSALRNAPGGKESVDGDPLSWSPGAKRYPASPTCVPVITGPPPARVSAIFPLSSRASSVSQRPAVGQARRGDARLICETEPRGDKALALLVLLQAPGSPGVEAGAD